MTDRLGQGAEKWREVEGFSKYRVSNLGRVKRVIPAPGTWPGRILEGSSNGHYKQVDLKGDDGEFHTMSVHRLVARAFLGPPRGRQVNHKDADKRNNHVDNLEWVTHKENARHARKLGLMPTGERVGTSKLREEQVLSIRWYYYNTDLDHREIARRFQVAKTTVGVICRREWWSWLPKVVGEKGPNDQARKFAPNQVREVRRLARSLSQRELADKFGCSQSTISSIVRGDIYAWVDNEPDKESMSDA